MFSPHSDRSSSFSPSTFRQTWVFIGIDTRVGLRPMSMSIFGSSLTARSSLIVGSSVIARLTGFSSSGAIDVIALLIGAISLIRISSRSRSAPPASVSVNLSGMPLPMGAPSGGSMHRGGGCGFGVDRR